FRSPLRSQGGRSVENSWDSSSAADWKFLQCLQQGEELQIEKRHQNHRFASAPWLPKFASEVAAMYHELRKRGTSAGGPQSGSDQAETLGYGQKPDQPRLQERHA